MKARINLISEKSQKELYAEAVHTSCEQALSGLSDPHEFPEGRARIQRSLKLLEGLNLSDKYLADLGCGRGVLAAALANQGARVFAVDGSSTSLAKVSHPSITPQIAFLPYLTVADATFDGIVFTDVLAELEPHLYRLMISELSRLLKAEGWLLISTALDLHTLDADLIFLDLLETEFEPVALCPSYFRLWGCVKKLLPSFIQQQDRLALALESFSEKGFGPSHKSHLIVLARKRKMGYHN